MEHLDDLRWCKSSYSGNGGNCVEVAASLPGAVTVRDSTDRTGPKLRFGEDAWRQFTEQIKTGGLRC
jgi:uncharacterized protein DUF397